MMLAAGGRTLASGSDDVIETESPPHSRLIKPCEEGKPFLKEYHMWSWTKDRMGARVEFNTGEWNHRWLAHLLCQHGLVTSVEPQRNKL